MGGNSMPLVIEKLIILNFDYRLLQTPFDFAQAFDVALKKVIATLPNRSAKETADDVVRCRIYYLGTDY